MLVAAQTGLFVPVSSENDDRHPVHAEDCRKIVPALLANRVSLIVTDPPCFIDGMGDDWDRGALERRKRGCGGMATHHPARRLRFLLSAESACPSLRHGD